MKKLFGIFLTVLLGVTLVACKPEEKPTPGITDADIVTIAKNQLSLGTADEMASVQTDLDFPEEINASDNKVQVSWKVDKPESVIVRDGKGLVVLKETDVEVKVTATLKYKTATDTKEFNITVKAKEIGDNKVDTINHLLTDITKLDLGKDETTEGSYEIKGEVVVIAVGSDGFIVTDGTGAILLYKATGAKVGDKGFVVGKINNKFGTNVNFVNAQFVKTHESATDEEIKAMAKESTIGDLMTVKHTTVGENTEVFDQSANLGFFKVTGKVQTRTVSGKINPHAVDVTDKDKQLVHYYKYEDHDFYTAIGNSDITNEGVDIYLAIHDRNSQTNEFRVAFYMVDVVLDDQAKAGVDLSAASNLDKLFYENGTLKLLSSDKAAFGTTIEYSLGDTAHSSIINVETGAVTPGDDLVAVTLKVKATLNGKVAETELVIQTGKPKTITTVVGLDDLANGTVVKIKGTISGNQFNDKYDNGGKATLTDATGSTLVYNYDKKFKDILKNDEEFELIGIVGDYKGTKQLINVAYVVKVA